MILSLYYLQLFLFLHLFFGASFGAVCMCFIVCAYVCVHDCVFMLLSMGHVPDNKLIGLDWIGLTPLFGLLT